MLDTFNIQQINVTERHDGCRVDCNFLEDDDMEYKDGTEAMHGDVIRWKVWDNDDCTTWTFTGMVKGDMVVYLGGGIDFGHGIGQLISFDEVIIESEDNDCEEGCGISKIVAAHNPDGFVEVPDEVAP